MDSLIKLIDLERKEIFTTLANEIFSPGSSLKYKERKMV